jgi:hypothetical protein
MKLKQIVFLLKHLIARMVGVKANQISDTEVISTAKKIQKLYDHKTPNLRPPTPRKGFRKVFRA